MNNVASLLATPTKYFRTPISRGGQPRVDRDGGYRQAGMIHGVSVITQGEALGHDMWIDQMMVEQVADAINAYRNGVKSRFTHPSLSGDGLGKHVGRIMDAELSTDGRQALADQHFLQTAHRSPDGDLAGYLMDLAEEDSESYGLSIVFAIDEGEMRRFEAEHTDEKGNFTSPDPLNVNHYPHARLAELRAIDSVDEPAANPNGLFHREQDIAQQADALASYALGIAPEKPETVQLGLDPDRVRGFVSRFLSNHKLEIRKMADEQQAAEAPVEVTAEAPVETTVETVATETTDTEPTMNGREQAAEFVAKFGERGAVWYAEGLSFEEARDRQVTELQKEVGELKTKLAARQISGEDSPVSFDATETKRGGLASKIRIK